MPDDYRGLPADEMQSGRAISLKLELVRFRGINVDRIYLQQRIPGFLRITLRVWDEIVLFRVSLGCD